jgi:hypothetical protein
MQESRCTRCKGHHHTKNCYHDPVNVAKRPKDWVVGGKKEFGTVSIDLIDPIVHKPDFLIIAIEHNCPIDSSVIGLTIAREHESSTKLKPNFSLVAINSLTMPSRLAIDTQLLQIQDRVNKMGICLFLIIPSSYTIRMFGYSMRAPPVTAPIVLMGLLIFETTTVK